MPFNKKFELRLYVPDHWEVAGDMPDRWANGLKNAAEVMNDRRQAKIPDDGTFIIKVATPANTEWSKMLDPTFVSRSDRTAGDIKGTHAKNISSAYDRWNDKINKSFETKDGIPAKEFKEKVDNSKDRWAERIGEKTLRFTGDKIRGLSVAPITAYYLVGDNRAQQWLSGDNFLGDGAPYNIAKNLQRTALKAAIQQRLVQGGMMIVNNESLASVITAENNINTELLNGLRDPAKAEPFVTTVTADKSYCLWEVNSEGRLFLHVQVGITIP